jgi:hypothetical protein
MAATTKAAAGAPAATTTIEARGVYAALAAARQEFARAAKDGSNPHLKNRYPTLAAIVDACDEALARHGLTYSQPIVQTPAGPALRTVLVHLETGERIESDCPLLYDGGTKVNPMQALGSAITYARRYGLESLLGLMREDDDGEGAFPRGAAHAARSSGAPPATAASSSWSEREARGPAAPSPAQAGEGRPPQPFGVWVRAAAEQLGVEDVRLVNHLHDRAVKQALMPGVEPEMRAQALARRYYDRQKGREWRDWMRAECKTYQAELQASEA